MSAYAIAVYIPEEARREVPTFLLTHQRDEQDYFCPLGAVLRVLGQTRSQKMPTAPYFVTCLSRHVRLNAPPYEVIRAAQAFMHDWDQHKITDLADALGVPS